MAYFLLIFLCPATVFGQVVELDTVLTFPQRILNGFYVSELNKLYISSRNKIYVVDCSTCQMGEIPISWGGDNHFAYNQQGRKLYVKDQGYSDSVAVIDVLGDTVIKWISISGIQARNLAYARNTNRLYFGGVRLCVVNCDNDSIIREIAPPLSGYYFAAADWDAEQMKLYVSLARWGYPPMMAVYDTSESLVALLRVPIVEPFALQFHHQLGKAYFAGYAMDCAGVIDTKNDTFVRWFPILVVYSGLVPYALDTIDDKFYCAAARQHWPDTLYVIDCVTDSIVKKLLEAGWGPLSVRWAAWSNRLYFTGGPRGETLKVLDCRTDSVIDRVYLEEYSLFGPPDIELDPVRHRIFAIGCDSALYVLRELEQGVEEERSNNPGRSAPTVVRGVLYLPERAGAAGKPVLVDITGRRVRELVPGANDVRGLVPGVYFVRSNAGVERKVVIAR
ncbi:MAG: hypothetical protein ABIK48_01725 [candidate division WOR-3 bacterium]